MTMMFKGSLNSSIEIYKEAVKSSEAAIISWLIDIFL